MMLSFFLRERTSIASPLGCESCLAKSVHFRWAIVLSRDAEVGKMNAGGVAHSTPVFNFNLNGMSVKG
jgi:hypothetical protein